jgi:hypothetical protein
MDGDNPQIQHWLGWLRDGTKSQKVAARHSLAQVFEERNIPEEAIELLENNVRAGVRSGEIFRWLARLYHEQGDETRSVEALAEAAKYQPGSFTSESSVLSQLPTGSTPTRKSRKPALYLLAILGLGIAVGAAVWLVARFLRP